MTPSSSKSTAVGLVLEFLEAHPGLTAANVALALVLAPLGDVLLPHLYGRLVSSVEGRHSVVRPTALILLVLAFAQAGSFAKDYIDMKTQPRLENFIRTRMMASYIDENDGDLSEPRAGQLISGIVRFPDVVRWWAECYLVYVVPYGMTLAWSTYYFFRQDALLAGTLLILLVTLAVLLFWAPRGCTAAAVGREHAVQAVHEGADDLIRNLASVYGAGTADDEVARLGRAGDAYRVRNEEAMRCLLRYKAVGVPLVVSFVAAVVMRCNHLVRTGRMKTGSFVSLFMITTTMIGTLTWLVSLIRDTTLDSGIIISFGPGVARPQRNGEASGGASGVGGSAHLMAVGGGDGGGEGGREGGIDGDAPLRAVGVSYAPALVDVDVAFEEGERTALVGPVGSGKSTLLRLIAGLVRPQAGELFLAGRPYSQIGLKAVRRFVGYMPQEAVLFDRTVGENLLYGTKAARGDAGEAVVRFARWLGLWEHLEPGLPDGLSTRVGKNGSMLSGGQRQLVWFLRIAFRGPPVLLLDEPTASMDETTRRALITAVARLLEAAGGRMTVVMATHDAGLMAFATRTVHVQR